jgi:membrane protease YdiL (CAAX protease family)
VAVAAAYLFELVGVDATPQAAEQAAYAIDPWLILIAFVVLAPIAEEFFFRGIVFNAWLREGGARFAYIGSAALFAVSHLSPIQFAPLFLLGLALAAIYRRTGSLLAAMAMHATFNAITVAIVFLDRFGVVNLPT